MPEGAGIISTRAILIITNDFPPQQGGIETFIFEITQRLPADQIVVLTSAGEGDQDFDAQLNYPVIRRPVKYLLPTTTTLHLAQSLIKKYNCTAVWFGAAAPLGLLAQPLRKQGITTIVATTHGHEIWWARLPGSRQLLTRIGRYSTVITYLGDYTYRRLAPAFNAPMTQLTPGVDSTVFHPNPQARQALATTYGYNIEDKTVICISRMVERKGHDILIKAWPRVTEHFPNARLLLGGKGPYEKQLRALAAASPARSLITFTGPIDPQLLPDYYAGVDVFAMPCRSRKLGLEAEGLGIVYLEAQACGTPAIAGQSGGAPDAVLDHRTGRIVDGRSSDHVATAIIELLSDPELTAMGHRGREWMQDHWSWEKSADKLLRLLINSTD